MHSYFQQNWNGILIIISLLILIRIIVLFYNIQFDKKKKKVSNVIVIEKFKNDFCKTEDLEKECGKLFEMSCNTTDCCAWAKIKGKKPKCIPGDISGPVFKSNKKGKKYNFDFYYFKNKKIPISKLM